MIHTYVVFIHGICGNELQHLSLGSYVIMIKQTTDFSQMHFLSQLSPTFYPGSWRCLDLAFNKFLNSDLFIMVHALGSRSCRPVYFNVSFLVLKKPGNSLTLDAHFQYDALWTMSVTYRDSGVPFTKDFSACLHINDWLHYISSHIFKTDSMNASQLGGQGETVEGENRVPEDQAFVSSLQHTPRRKPDPVKTRRRPAGSRNDQDARPCACITPSSCSLQGTRKQTVPRTEYVGYVSQACTRSKDNTPSAAKSPQSITAPLIISISYLQGARPQAHVKTLSVPLKLLLLYRRENLRL